MFTLIRTFIILFILCGNAFSADPPPSLYDEGVKQGVIFQWDCVGPGIACSKSGIKGTFTVDGTIGGGWTDDGSVVRLTSSGDNVGIGTTTPGGKLVVAGGNVGIGYTAPGSVFDVNGNVGIGVSVAGDKLIVSNGIHARGVGTGLTANDFMMDESSGTGRFVSNGPDTSTRGGMNFIIQASDNTLSITPIGILNSGNVGIGNSVPGATLLAYRAVDQIQEIVRGHTTQTARIFEVQDNISGQNPYFTVTGNGNVGIGNSIPGGKFIVNSGNVGLGYTAPGTVLAVNGNVGIGASIAGDSLIVATGNVGIGTTAPGAKLEVTSSSQNQQRWQNATNKYMDLNVNSSADISFSFPSSSSADVSWGMDTDGTFDINGTGHNNSSGNNLFRVSYSPGAINDSTGNNYNAASISLSPSAGVQGSAGPNLAALAIGVTPHNSDTSDPAYSGINIRYATNSSSAIQLGLIFTGQDIPYEIVDFNDLNLTTIGMSGPNTGMVIDSTGNVGVGTTTPQQQLDVLGNINVDGRIGVGITSSSYTAAFSETFTQTSGIRAGVSVGATHNAASDTTTETTIGMNFTANASGTHTHGSLLGINGLVETSGSGSVAQAQGGSFLVKNSGSADTSSGYGANFAFLLSGSGNISNGIGLQVAAPTYTSTGRITSFAPGIILGNQGHSGTANSAALFIQDQSGSDGLSLSGYIEGGMFLFNVNKTSTSDFVMNGDNVDNLFMTDASEDDVEMGGHIETTGTAPTVGTCGTSPSITSTATDMGGKVTIGTGGVTSCAVTFNSTWDNAPACIVIGNGTGYTLAAATTTTVLTITSSADMSSAVLMFNCFGQE